MSEEEIVELKAAYDKLYRHKEDDRTMTALVYYEKMLPLKIYETLCEIRNLLLDTRRNNHTDDCSESGYDGHNDSPNA